MTLYAFQVAEVDVVDGRAFVVAIDEINGRAANPFDGGKTQLHRPRRDVYRLRAVGEREFVRLVRVPDTKRQTTGRRAVLFSEISREALRFAVDDEVYVALPVQRDLLGAVYGNFGET